MKHSSINKQAGFTLIELIMVIVILGVLSAFALPRFADLGGDARTASINGLAGSLKSAANIAHAQYLAQGSTGDVVLEGATITMVNGYPSAVAAGIGAASQISAGTSTQFDQGAVDYIETVGTGAITYALKSSGCEAVYTAATASTATPPVISAPVVTIDVSDC